MSGINANYNTHIQEQYYNIQYLVHIYIFWMPHGKLLVALQLVRRSVCSNDFGAGLLFFYYFYKLFGYFFPPYSLNIKDSGNARLRF